MRYFAELQYNGAEYFGWQRQRNAVSVQQRLEEALSTLSRENVETVGAGRTDSGVNASYYVAHFDLDAPIADTRNAVHKLNAILPKDISVFNLTRVADTAHARFDAVEREYRYYVSLRKDVFNRNFTWQYNIPLNINEMNRAAEALLHHGDFTSFAKLNSNNKTNICHISTARWDAVSNDMLRFTIRADRFLRNMVRAITGTLVDVGRGRYTADDFDRIISARDLSLASGGAPARGLFLHDVKYPDGIFRRTVAHSHSTL